MFKELLQKGIEGYKYSESEAKQLMDLIMGGKATSSQIASLLTMLRFRGETVDELTGFVSSMREHVLKLEGVSGQVVDTCGTGGDGASTFNISTTSAIVMASLGVKVAKHGNRAFTSKSGSADALEKLGLPIQTSPEEAIRALEDYNMTFLFAPLYHHAMKHAVNPRKEIGFRTVFNVLGPLSNPAGSKHQLIGVFSKDLAIKMAESLKRLGTERALLVTGDDGLDEISISASTNVIELSNNEIKEYQIHPTDFNMKECPIDSIKVQTSEESARIIKDIFLGKASEGARNIVALNSGAGLYVAGKVRTLQNGVEEALQAINSGIAYDHYVKMKGNEVAEHYA